MMAAEAAAAEQDDREAAAARHGWEVLRAYRAALGEEPGPAWEDAPGAAHVRTLVAVNVLARGDEGGEARHRRWLAERSAEGWRYAEREDRARRLSPCMRPWASLSPEQRAKDALWCAAVLGALALLSPPRSAPVEDEGATSLPALDNPPALPFTITGNAPPSRAERRAQQRGKGR
jgi:hypothetical protein